MCRDELTKKDIEKMEARCRKEALEDVKGGTCPGDLSENLKKT